MSDVHEPQWLRIAAVGPVLAIAAFGSVGLVLADLGWYHPLLVFPLGLLALFGLWWLARPLFRVGREPTAPTRAGARFALAMSIAYALWNGVNASQHVQINRDGGAYLNAGKWLATHGTLTVNAYVGAFDKGAPTIATSTDILRHGHHLEFARSHLLSTILAEAQYIGGDHMMFLVVPILSGLSLLVFYLLAHKLLRHPFAALAAVLTLALLMPEISFSRDSTTEVPIQLLLLTAVWLLCDRHTLRDRGTAFCAGLVLGLVQAMRIDGVAFMLGLPVVYATIWLHAKRADRRRLRRGILWSLLGLGAGLLLGVLDLLRTDQQYLAAQRGNIEKLAAAALLIAAIVALVMVTRSGRMSIARRVRGSRLGAGDIAGGLVLVAGFGAWFVRPLVEKTHARSNPFVGLVQHANHLAIDPTRRYSEMSLRWVSWYVGPVTLFIAIVAAAAFVRALVRGSLKVPMQVPALILAPPALLYIWRPNVTPDQVWAARRFVPAVFPAVILLVFGALCLLARDRSRRYAAERRFFAIVLAVATAAFPLYTIRAVTQMTEQRNLVPVITSVCKIIGPHAAVVMPQETRSTAYLNDPQTLRSFCNVPVAVMLGPPKPLALRELATKWATEGRRLFVVAQYADTVRRADPKANLRFTPVGENQHLLDLTLTHRPHRYISELSQLTAAVVPVLRVPASS